MTQKTIKQFINLLEQEDVPIRQLLLDFNQFSKGCSEENFNQIIKDYKIYLSKKIIVKQTKQLSIYEILND